MLLPVVAVVVLDVGCVVGVVVGIVAAAVFVVVVVVVGGKCCAPQLNS